MHSFPIEGPNRVRKGSEKRGLTPINYLLSIFVFNRGQASFLNQASFPNLPHLILPDAFVELPQGQQASVGREQGVGHLVAARPRFTRPAGRCSVRRRAPLAQHDGLPPGCRQPSVVSQVDMTADAALSL